MSDNDNLSRRALLANASLLGGAMLLSERAEAQPAPPSPAPARNAMTAPPAARGYVPVVVPNGTKLPWKMVGGVKVYHLVAEEVEHEMAPGLRGHFWGYNGSVHGPLIEAVEGDRVRIYVT